MKLCLGTVQFGTNYGIQEAGKPKCEDVFSMIDYAIEHGITQFDTAPAYCEAEALLGDYIRSNAKVADKMNIISKLDSKVFDECNKKDMQTIALRNAEESLKKLSINFFSAYLFHNASYIFDEYAVKALNSVKLQGLTKRIGVSVYTPQEAMKALEYDEIDVVQIPYNVFDHRLDKCGFFKKAKEQGVEIYARSSLLQGLAVMDASKLPSRVGFAKDYITEFENLCIEQQLSRLEAAIGYVLCKRELSYIVFGVDNISQLKEYINIEKIKISNNIISIIDERFKDVPEKLVNPSLWK